MGSDGAESAVREAGETGAALSARPDEGWMGHVAMLAFSALVAGSFSLGGLVANDIAPAALNAARFLLAAVLIGAIAWGQGTLSAQAFRAPWRYGVLGGLFATYFVLMFEGLKTAAPVNTAVVFTLTPIMAAVAAYGLLRQRLTRRMTLGLSIGGLGALWVIFRADISAFLGFEVGRGEVVYFVGCIAYAIYTPMVRRLNRGEPAVVFTFGLMVAGFLVLLAFWLAADLGHRLAASVCPGVGHRVLYGGVCQCGDICVVAICSAAAASGKSDGLYIFNAQLGNPVGNSVGARAAAGGGFAGHCSDHRGFVDFVTR